jgi:hypothetical protein
MNQANAEKKLLKDGLPTSYPPIPAKPNPTKMPSLRYLLLTILLLSLLGCGLASANANARVPRSPTKADQKKFQEIVGGVKQLDNYKVSQVSRNGKLAGIRKNWITRSTAQ